MSRISLGYHQTLKEFSLCIVSHSQGKEGGSMPSLPDTQYTAFRRTEKHFKDRSIRGRLPPLHGQKVLDLSRPAEQEEDEVWQAGWWGAQPGDEGAMQWRKWKKGKERMKGERPEQPYEGAMAGLRSIDLEDGWEGWVVADGTSLL